MNNERGSTWNRWDFHVHTPYSLLNNEYGFDPYATHMDASDPFDEYVRTLFTKAIEAGVAAIGVTDYFSIDGYKRIRQEYLDNPEKMTILFPDEVLRKKVRDIFVFPNIEFRLDTFVGRNRASVNYHVIFSDTVSLTDIEENFIQSLQLTNAPDSTLPLTKNNIERIGHEYKTHNPGETRSDYLVGLEHITVRDTQIIEVLRKSIFAGKFFISIPVDEDLSQIDWKGRDYQTRKLLYQQCHLLMTSNPQTREWALAKGREEAHISEFGSIKPCIWGSDAHSYDRMFCPDNDRFCWVKADATFEGLQQVLYEPEDRVRIQRNRPEDKDEHQIIDHIIFEDTDFPSTPIFLSEGLTAIIGGKSTGKSILLRHIAKGVDQKQVDEREKGAVGSGSKLNITAKTVWKDGVSGERKIIYIPQSWLNRIVDDSSGDSQLNRMLRDILLQQEEISGADAVLRATITDIIAVLRHDIVDYVAACEKVESCERSLRDFGRSVAFQSAIERLESQREALSIESGITEQDLQKYAELAKAITGQSEVLDELKKEEPQIEFRHDPFVFLPQITVIDGNNAPQYDLSNIPTTRSIIESAIQKMNTMILEIWHIAMQEAQQLLAGKIKEAKDALEELQASIEPLQRLVSKNEELRKIESQLQGERNKLRKAKELEEAKAESYAKAEELKKKILASRWALRQAYESFASVVSTASASESDLEFAAEVHDKRQELFDAISSLFDNRNMRPFRERFHYDILDKEGLSIDDGLFESLWIAMTEGTLAFKAGNTVQTALERLFSDWLYVHYTVKSGNDTIVNMSPGKKALVLLEMIVNLEKSKCPILIDQPEDDLDNRSIYTDLVSYLKAKKHERQIIVVTHNANVVVGADAEEVIIANQRGKESPNRETRFEYRTGSIENTTPVLDEHGIRYPGVLNQKGIQDQICDILEGGRDAFELRRKKYIRT